MEHWGEESLVDMDELNASLADAGDLMEYAKSVARRTLRDAAASASAAGIDEDVPKGPIPSSDGTFAAELSGRYRTFRHGTACFQPGGMVLTLSDEGPFRCNCIVAGMVPTDSELFFVIPTGPDATFFASRELSVFANWKGSGPTFAKLHLDPVEVRVSARVRGSIEIPRKVHPTGVAVGRGHFEATVCAPPWNGTLLKPAPISQAVLNGAIRGTAGGSPFTAQSVFLTRKAVVAFADRVSGCEDVANAANDPDRLAIVFELPGPLGGVHSATVWRYRGRAGIGDEPYAFVEVTPPPEPSTTDVKVRVGAISRPGTERGVDVVGSADARYCPEASGF